METPLLWCRAASDHMLWHELEASRAELNAILDEIARRRRGTLGAPVEPVR